jgi:hypothetical protein
VAVEAALVTPLMLAIVLGILEFGMVFKDSLTMSSAVRAGARLASAEPRVSTFATDAAAQVANEATALNMGNVSELWVYDAEPDGTPVGDTGNFDDCTKCVKFTWDGSQFVEETTSWVATDHNACQGDSDRDMVGVYLEVEHPSISNLFFNTLVLSEHTVMSLEPIPSMQVCKQP